MRAYRLTPNDVLFFRDARPLEGGARGYGCRWPTPALMFGALHAALYRAFPAVQAWEHRHCAGDYRTRSYADDNRTQRFGSLNIAGPFPLLNNEWLFPRPADAWPDGRAFAPLRDVRGLNDLPYSWLRSVGALRRLGKHTPGAWIARGAFAAAQTGGLFTAFDDSALFAAEHATGIGISPDTGAQDGIRIYSADYLRLRDEAHMGLLATLPLKPDGAEGLDRLFPNDDAILVCGGQQRVCSVRRLSHDAPDAALPPLVPVAGARVKWSLLTPAVFPSIGNHPGGWLPSWVSLADGRVMLKKGDAERGPRENRVAWRKRVESLPNLDCRLVAALTPKPIAVSGWDVVEGNAKPTVMAVPAGAVYYFEGPDAPALAVALNHRRRSTLLGEQGFGLGVCAPWDWFEDVAGRPVAGAPVASPVK